MSSENSSKRERSGNAPANAGDREESLTSSPVDQVHLDRQTLGDAALRAEVLQLYRQQAQGVSARIAVAGDDERRQLAHGLRGSSSGIGAFAAAECARQVEEVPGDLAAVGRLQDEIAKVLAYIDATSD